MTLIGYFALNSVFARVYLAPTVKLSKNNCVKTNKDRYIPSTAEIFGREFTFWQYKVIADIRSGSLERRQWGRALTLVLNIFSWISKTIA